MQKVKCYLLLPPVMQQQIKISGAIHIAFDYSQCICMLSWVNAPLMQVKVLDERVNPELLVITIIIT